MNLHASRRELLGRGVLAASAGLAGLAGSATAQDAAKPYQFSFGLNTGTIRGYKLDLPQQIDVAARAGYEGIEPWTSDVSRFVQSGGSLKDLGKKCKDQGLKVYGGIGFAPWAVDDDAQRAKGLETLKREMDQLAEMGGTHIAAPPSGVNKAGVKLDLDRAGERYRAILEIGRQTGVIPQLEIWGASANLSNLAQACYVAAKAGHADACILSDVFHMYKGGSDAAGMALLSPRAVHCLHVNDYPASPDRQTITDAQRIWPGDGIAPLKEILAALASNGCKVMLSLELFNAEYWKQPVAETAATGLAKMKAAVKAAGLV